LYQVNYLVILEEECQEVLYFLQGEKKKEGSSYLTYEEDISRPDPLLFRIEQEIIGKLIYYFASEASKFINSTMFNVED